MDAFDVAAMCQRLTHVLDHAQQVRAWATQTTQISATERDKILAQLTDLEQAAQALIVAYGATENRSAETLET